MTKKIVAANWKMNGRLESIIPLLKELIATLPSELQTTCVVFPPAIYLPLVSDLLSKTQISWGAQNIYPCDKGPYTGEIAVSMLNDFFCKYVLIGHSERRTLFGEEGKFIAEKFHQVKDHGMIPLLCIGETWQEREQRQTDQVLFKQLHAIAESTPHAFNQCVIAYEPVWAIGTGQAPLPEQVQDIHQKIRAFLIEWSGVQAAQTPILYGGSVNEKNAKALFAMPDVDGGLIGGASLNARQFVEIVKCIN